MATEHQNVVSVTAELNLKVHLILTINFNRHMWLTANILDSTDLEANVPVSELVGGDQHHSLLILPRDSPWIGVSGPEHESPLGSNG